MNRYQRRFELGAAQTRHYDDNERTISGIAVPDGQVVSHFFGDERVETSSATFAAPCIALRDHNPDNPIGTVELSHTAAGIEYTITLADTESAREAWELAKVGAYRASIGFVAQFPEPDDDGVITWRNIEIYEVSMVTFPAYDTTANSRKEHDNMPDDKLDKVLTELTAMRNDMDAARAANIHKPEPNVMYRSLGAHIQAMARGDQNAIEQWRDWTGGTTANEAQPPYVLDLQATITASRPVVDAFSGPADIGQVGMSVDYPTIESNTTIVTAQAKEGDDLPEGAVKLKMNSAGIKTYGGYVSMTMQQLARTSAASIDITWATMAKLYARQTQALLIAELDKVLTANASEAVGSSVNDASGWVGAMLDALDKAEEGIANIDFLGVSPAVYKELATMLDVDGRRLLRVVDTGNLGTIAISSPAQGGRIDGLVVRRLPGLSGRKAAFCDATAVRLGEDSRSPMHLTEDPAARNLTQGASLYGFVTAFAPLPSGIIPVSL